MENNNRNMQRDGKKRVRRRHRYDHRDHGDHTRRCRNHKRHVKEDDGDIHRDKGHHQSKLREVYKGISCNRKVFRQEYDDHDSKEIRKKRRKSEELISHDLKEGQDDSLPLLLSSTTVDSDVVVAWVSLPRDAVFFILDKLLEPIDHVRFAAVSKEWRCVAKYYNHTTQRWQKLLPMLMVPTGSNGEQKLYSVPERKFYDHIRLPVPYNDMCYGSNYGWLATIDKSLKEITITDPQKNPFGGEIVVVTYRITLRNPFRKEVEAIHLPPLNYSFLKDDDRYTYLVPHVILSADPTMHPENYVVSAFCNHYMPLAFIKGGHKEWVQLKSSRVVQGNHMYSTAIFFRNKIYAIDDYGTMMMAVDVNSSINSPEERILKVSPDRLPCLIGAKTHLVESTKGDLLYVRKCYDRKKAAGVNNKWLTITSFRVYKIVFNDQDESAVQLVEMKTIGDDAIFLVDSHSMSVSASNFPGCLPNSIYYTSNDSRKYFQTCKDGRKCDMGIFNLDLKIMTPLYSSEDQRFWNNYMPRWVLPSFKF